MTSRTLRHAYWPRPLGLLFAILVAFSNGGNCSEQRNRDAVTGLPPANGADVTGFCIYATKADHEQVSRFLQLFSRRTLVEITSIAKSSGVHVDLRDRVCVFETQAYKDLAVDPLAETVDKFTFNGTHIQLFEALQSVVPYGIDWAVVTGERMHSTSFSIPWATTVRDILQTASAAGKFGCLVSVSAPEIRVDASGRVILPSLQMSAFSIGKHVTAK